MVHSTLLGFLAGAVILVEKTVADCLSNQEFNEFFENKNGGPIPAEGSCCQKDVCGIPCPEEVSAPTVGE
jgi:hypothetical protein